ncbi:MAG: hypothetical protein WCW13_06605 [archaeon]|jgi:hypothetical protein
MQKKQREFKNIVLSRGVHSVPRVVSFNDKKWVYKQSSLSKGLSLKEAASLASSVRSYHQDLNKAGLNISKLL